MLGGDGFVYFIIQEPYPQHEMMKIGFGWDPERRRKAFQTGNPYPLKLIAQAAAPSLAEHWVHGVLAPYRLMYGGGSEWFHGLNADEIEKVYAGGETACGLGDLVAAALVGMEQEALQR